MPSEEIELQFRTDASYFDELDRRFQGLADRFVGRLSQAGRSLGGAASAAGQVPGGGGGTQASMIPSTFGAGVAFGLNAGGFGAGLAGAGQEIRSAPTGLNLFGPGGFQSQNVTPNLQRAAVGYLGGVLENTVGKIPGFGDVIMAQVNGYREAFFGPQDRTSARLKSIYGSLAAGGFNASEEEIKVSARFGLAAEERRMWTERKVDSIVRQVDAPRAVERGLNSCGLGQ